MSELNTKSAQELAELKAQIELIKAKKEVQEYEKKVTEAAKAPQVRESERFTAAVQAGEDFRQVKSSRVRGWGVVLGHVLCPPVASVVYATKTEKWAPALAATAVAVVGAPLAMMDMGLTLSIAAPVTSVVMTLNQVKADRKSKGFMGPEQADVAYFSRSF